MAFLNCTPLLFSFHDEARLQRRCCSPVDSPLPYPDHPSTAGIGLLFVAATHQQRAFLSEDSDEDQPLRPGCSPPHLPTETNLFGPSLFLCSPELIAGAASTRDPRDVPEAPGKTGPLAFGRQSTLAQSIISGSVPSLVNAVCVSRGAASSRCSSPDPARPRCLCL